MDNFVDIKKMDFSFLGRGSSFNGIFTLKGTTYLNSQLDGKIIVKDKGHFIVEDEGVLVGTLSGHDVDIFGRFEGILTATGRLIIHSTAHVSGEIIARKLVIRPNSYVNIKAQTTEES